MSHIVLSPLARRVLSASAAVSILTILTGCGTSRPAFLPDPFGVFGRPAPEPSVERMEPFNRPPQPPRHVVHKPRPDVRPVVRPQPAPARRKPATVRPAVVAPVAPADVEEETPHGRPPVGRDDQDVRGFNRQPEPGPVEIVPSQSEPQTIPGATSPAPLNSWRNRFFHRRDVPGEKGDKE